MLRHTLAAGLGLAVFAAAGPFLSAPVSAQTHRPALSGYVSAATDYRRRGLSQTNGGAALQIGVDYQHASGFFAGAWASNAQFDAAYGQQESDTVEADYYAGFDLRRERWSFTTTLTRYGYSSQAPSYDYTELNAMVGYADRLYYSAAYTNDLYSHGESALHQELSARWPFSGRLELSGTLGRLSSDYVEGGAYTHWDVGVSRMVGRVSFDIRRYDTNYRDTYSYLGDPRAERWVVSASYGFLSRR